MNILNQNEGVIAVVGVGVAIVAIVVSLWIYRRQSKQQSSTTTIPGVTIEGNEISDNGKGGVNIEGDMAPVLKNNVIQRNGGKGINIKR